MKYPLISLLFMLGCNDAMASEHRCFADATAQAGKLLAFHVGEQEPDCVSFEEPSLVSPLKNPADPRQTLDVVEVVASISPHGEYRMRFIYYTMPDSCLLMGQEILEHAIP